MITMKLLPAIAATFGLLSGMSLVAEEAVKPDASETKAEAAKKALVGITIAIAKDAKPDHCLMTISLKNISDYDLMFNQAGIMPFCKLTIVDKEGKKCLFDAAGAYVFHGTPNVVWSNVIVPLRKGEEKSWTVDLAKHTKLETGEYTLDFSIEPFLDVDETDVQAIHAYRYDYAHTSEVRGLKFSVGG
jgi:hypothetical protein